jgi:sugar lactone lactonase YvrE
VADWGNHRVMRWCNRAEEGTIVVGGNGKGEESNQLNQPRGLSFDGEGNLCVVDGGNDRLQKFEINFD